MKWVYKLPLEIRNEILRDCVEITTELCGDNVDLYEVIDNVMREKLVNVIGHEDGLLDADKYWKYLSM
jgi:hypothetical protein